MAIALMKAEGTTMEEAPVRRSYERMLLLSVKRASWSAWAGSKVTTKVNTKVMKVKAEEKPRTEPSMFGCEFLRLKF